MMPIQTEASLPKFVTVAELVAVTKVSRQTISRKLRKNEIPHVRLGERILIPASFLTDMENAAFAAAGQRGVS